jgi:YjbE family integral membrane protein
MVEPNAVLSSNAWAGPLAAFAQVVVIDLVLAGDNAVAVGLAAAGLDPVRRRRVIMLGLGSAVVMRIVLALVALRLLALIGLMLAGGLLLLWVCWKMWRDLRATSHQNHAGKALSPGGRRKTFAQATLQIIVADVSMSLDNVLAVAGAAREHPFVLAFGLLLSVALMGIAANLLGRLIQTHRWIAYLGLAVILYVACEMIYRGALELRPAIGA